MALPFKITLSFSFELGLCLEHLLVILFLLLTIVLQDCMEQLSLLGRICELLVQLLELRVFLL